MNLQIEHRLKFEYDDYISESWVELRIEPRSNHRQAVNSFVLSVGPSSRVFRYEDQFGNIVRHFSISDYHKEIEVVANSLVRTRPNERTLAAIHEPVTDPEGELLDFVSFSGPIINSASLRGLFDSIALDRSLPLGQQVRCIGEAVHEKIAYKRHVTTYDSTIDEALKHGAGVCQDLAQIMIGCLRLARIPARYVSGYVFVNPEVSEDSESHAWVEIYSRERGWIGYDPTSAREPGEKHLVVATARHYDEVPPNRGVYRGNAKERMDATVRIKEIEEPPFNIVREELRDINIPVYHEIPRRPRVHVVDEQAEQSSQQ